MSRTCASRLAFCIAFLAPLGVEVRADPIQMTVTGWSGIGTVNYSQVLPAGTVDTGYSSGQSPVMGSRTVGAGPTGPINAPISLTIGLADTALPGSQGLTLSLTGALTGQFVPWDAPGNFSGDPSVNGSGTISTIAISGLDPATNQIVSATIDGPNGTLSASALAQFASISGIPESQLAMMTTPSQYSIMPMMGGGIQGIYYGVLEIAPLSSPVPAPEPAPLAVLGLASVAYLVRRARAGRKDSLSCATSGPEAGHALGDRRPAACGESQP
jgi:hypothetical protein